MSGPPLQFYSLSRLRMYSRNVFIMRNDEVIYIYFCISDGRQEVVTFDKITSRIQKLCYGLNSDFVDPVSSNSSKVIHQHFKERSTNGVTLLAQIFYHNPLHLFSAGSDHNEGDPGSVQWSHHCGAGHSGSRDRGHPHHKTSRLCTPGRTNRCVEPAQRDQESIQW